MPSIKDSRKGNVALFLNVAYLGAMKKEYEGYVVYDTGRICQKVMGIEKEIRPASAKSEEVSLFMDGEFVIINIPQLLEDLFAGKGPIIIPTNVAATLKPEPSNVALAKVNVADKGTNVASTPKQRPSTQGKLHHNYKGPVEYKGQIYSCAAEAAKACGVHRSTVKRVAKRL